MFVICGRPGFGTGLRPHLSTAINDAIFGLGQVSAVYNTWDDLFNTLARQAHSKRLIVVIDEFPYLVAAYPPLASILTLKNSQTMLILNGSYSRIGCLSHPGRSVAGGRVKSNGEWQQILRSSLSIAAIALS